MKFYEVTSKFFNSGRVTARLTDTVEALTRPTDLHTETPGFDIYVDYFDTRDEAVEFIKETYESL